MRNHPLLQAATFEAEAANQVTREEKSAYYPTAIGSLTGVGAIPDSRIDAGYLNNPIIYNRYSNGLEINQLITDFGRTSNLVASARLGAKATSESAQQTAQDVLLAVNRAYFGVLRAEAVLKVAEETVKARQILADQITTLEKNKLRSLVDVSFAEVDLAQAQLLLVQAQNNEKASYADLATALGLANPQPFDLAEEPMPPAPLADPTDLIVQALQRSPGSLQRALQPRGCVALCPRRARFVDAHHQRDGRGGSHPGLPGSAQRPLRRGGHQCEYSDL